MASKLLNLEQAGKVLNCPEEKIKKLMKEGQLPYYKIAGKFVRFKEEEVLNLTNHLVNTKLEEENPEYTFTEKLVDFLYFNDFYILAILIIFLILAIIFLEVF